MRKDAFWAASALAATLTAVTTTGLASTGNPSLEEITIVGSQEDARALPGSGAVIGNDQIRVEAAQDINQLLKMLYLKVFRLQRNQLKFLMLSKYPAILFFVKDLPITFL